MARISSYNQDPNLEAQDRLVGSDVSNANQTVNFSLASLGDFYTKSGLADATRLGYRFNYIAGTAPVMGDDIIPMGIYFDNIDFSMVTSITVGAADANGYGFGVLEDILNNGRIKIITTRARGVETRAQGYFNVSNFVEILNNAGNAVAGYRLDLNNTGLTNAQEGSIRTGVGTNEPDDSFIILPLSPTESAAGNVEHAWRNFVVGGTTIDADGTEDTLTLIAGNDITLSGTDLDGGGSVTFSHATFNTSGTLTNTDRMFIQSITVDNGHITSVTAGQVPEGTTVQPSFRISGRTEIAAGAADTETYSLVDSNNSGVTPSNVVWTITPLTGVSIDSSTGVVTISRTDTTAASFTVTVTFDHGTTEGDTLTHTVNLFEPWYFTQLDSEESTFQSATRQTSRLVSGGTITIPSTSIATPEVYLQLPDGVFGSNQPTFLSGAFLLTPVTVGSGVTGTIGGQTYRQYVFSQSQNTPLPLTITRT